MHQHEMQQTYLFIYIYNFPESYCLTKIRVLQLYKLTFSSLGPTHHVNLLLDVKVSSS
jgi:hypothetical protein